MCANQSPMPIRVAVVSKHEVTRAGLCHLVGLDPSRARIVASVDEHEPLPGHDVAVIDLSHRSQGTRDLGQLLARADAPVVALVADDEPEVAVHAKRLGVGALVTMCPHPSNCAGLSVFTGWPRRRQVAWDLKLRFWIARFGIGGPLFAVAGALPFPRSSAKP